MVGNLLTCSTVTDKWNYETKSSADVTFLVILSLAYIVCLCKNIVVEIKTIGTYGILDTCQRRENWWN